MIALDTNFLVYLLVASHPEHIRARDWFASNKEQLSTTNINISEFLRLLTHAKVFPRPLSLDVAIGLIEDFKDNFQILVLDESVNWIKDLKTLSKSVPGIKGNEVFDAKIAQILKYNGVRKICTLDSDFKKYDFLDVVYF